MRKKIYAAIFVLVVASLTLAASFNYAGRTAAAPASPASATELLSMLPASDAVAYVDARRGLTEVMSSVFANDAPTLARINKELDKFRDDTGTDAHNFDSIAVAIRFKKTEAAQPEFVTGFARGRFNASEAITTALAKAKAKRPTTKWTEEQYDGTTIYSVERSGGFCVAAMDDNTIVFGDVEGIRAALDVRANKGARVDSSLVELATLNQGAVFGFAANIPPSLQTAAAKDDIGKDFASIKQVYGSADALGTMGVLSVTLRSETSEQAQAIAAKLSSLKQMVALFISQQESAQNGSLVAVPGDSQTQVGVRVQPFMSKWVKDVSITSEGNEVKLKLEEPLAELGAIARMN